MTAEDIFHTPGCFKNAAWLRAIRALPDSEFERLVQMQEEDERRHEECWAALGGIFEADGESAVACQVIPFPTSASDRAASDEVPF